MAFRSIEEFEQILLETPPAARYLDLHWAIANSYNDWREIRIRMAGAEMATRQIAPEHADDYAILRDIAAINAETTLAASFIRSLASAKEVTA